MSGRDLEAGASQAPVVAVDVEPSGVLSPEGLTGALRERLGKAVASSLQSAVGAIGQEQVDALTGRVNRAVEEVAQRLRAEIAETQRQMREEMQRKREEVQREFELERKHMRSVAMWQWVSVAALIVGTILKEWLF